MNMHLTNYAINKKSAIFNADENSGHKRKISTVYKQLMEEGEDIDEIKRQIDDIIIKTICMIHPNLSHCYKTAQPLDLSNSIFFHILGFDIMLDHK
jgi:lipoate synthase